MGRSYHFDNFCLYFVMEIHIGKILYQIHLPFHYVLDKEDKDFVHPLFIPNDIINVYGFFADDLEIPLETPISDQPGIKIWLHDTDEIRLYNVFYLQAPFNFALSEYKESHIDIRFNSKYRSFVESQKFSIWNLLHLESCLLQNEGIVLHCSYIKYKEKAILFTAPSGTGKTTQANIWKRVYASQTINGDRALLQCDNSKWYATGFPVHGSAPECLNQSNPLNAIIIVRQSATNYIEHISALNKIKYIYSECTVNSWNSKEQNMALDLIEDLVNKIPVYILHCTMDDNAAHVLHHELFGEI